MDKWNSGLILTNHKTALTSLFIPILTTMWKKHAYTNIFSACSVPVM